MLIEHGYSARCEGCRAALEGQPSQNHSEACRTRVLDSIGGKNAPEVEAQRKRFDAFVDKAAAKEDFQELEKMEREKKRMRPEETAPDNTGASTQVPPAAAVQKRLKTHEVLRGCPKTMVVQIWMKRNWKWRDRRPRQDLQ